MAAAPLALTHAQREALLGRVFVCEDGTQVARVVDFTAKRVVAEWADTRAEAHVETDALGRDWTVEVRTTPAADASSGRTCRKVMTPYASAHAWDGARGGLGIELRLGGTWLELVGGEAVLATWRHERSRRLAGVWAAL